jgi:Ser/Thr protein kinase RdoA (MazF antagonist)
LALLSCPERRRRDRAHFLAYLDAVGVPVAAPVPARDGALFTSALLPEGSRPAVLFRLIEGRSPKPDVAIDARAQGVTLARIHAAAEDYGGTKATRYRLDLDHLLHRQIAAVMGVRTLATKTVEYLKGLTSRLAACCCR